VLPHIAFNDPNLPWAVPVSATTGGDVEDMMPWLAIFPFDCARDTNPELRLTTDQLNGSKSIYQKRKADGTLDTSTKLQQSSTFTIPLTVAEYLKLPQMATANVGATAVHIPPFAANLNPVEYADMSADKSPVEVICMTFALFKELFPIITQPATTSGPAAVATPGSISTPMAHGGPIAVPDVSFPDISSYRHLSHVRNVNTSDTATTSASGGDDSGVFSIVHSRRTGPTGETSALEPLL
jgi:hypothetical protein